MVKSKKEYKFIFDEEDDVTFDMIGICSSSPIYRLTGELNKTLYMDLDFSHDLFEIHYKNKPKHEFPFYKQDIKEDLLSIYLIKNKYQGNTLIPELSQIDYFLFYANNQTIDITKVAEQIKTRISIVQVAFVYDPKEYPSTNNIIFDKHEKN